GYDDTTRQCTHTYNCARQFCVQQNPLVRRLLVAVVDDETVPDNIDPARFYEQVVTYPLRIGRGNNLEPETTFEEEFGLDFRFYHVGTYDWPNGLHGYGSSGEALRNTAYALGQGLKLGGCWVSNEVKHPDYSIPVHYTQRENHGFDVGLGLMFCGFQNHAGEGRAVQCGTLALTMGCTEPNWKRVKECGLHEICHLFGALHGDAAEYGNDKFGPPEDGYTYVMAGGTGQDFPPAEGWRMHPLTRERVSSLLSRVKFDGAPAPKSNGTHLFGQRQCHVIFNANARTWAVYRLDSDGMYHWGYNSGDYLRFSVSDSYDYVEPELQGATDRKVWTKHVQGDIKYPNPGKAEFYIAYELYWTSDHYPSGYDPASQGLIMSFEYVAWQDSGTTNSHVDNIRMRVISGRVASPLHYYFKWFDAASPSSGWAYCHGDWATQPDPLCYPSPTSVYLTDAEVCLLLGFRDAWSYDWQQELKVHLRAVDFRYWWETW
ncbi:MAG: hypothetical protein ACTSUH_08820, partial [Candidatus Thorarchaeota archaeon]